MGVVEIGVDAVFANQFVVAAAFGNHTVGNGNNSAGTADGGKPVEGIALVAGIDRILDMGRTVVNITGDAACTICVNAWETKREAKLARKAAQNR